MGGVACKERLLKNIRLLAGNCLTNNIKEDAKANLTGRFCPPGRLTNTVATAATPSLVGSMATGLTS